MRRCAFVLLLSLSTQALAGERGWVSAAGVGLSVAGLGLAGLGLSQALVSADARLAANAYGGSPSRDEAPAVARLDQRARGATTVAVVSLSAAAALLVGGIVCLVLDRPTAVPLAIVPTRDGAVLAFTLAL